MADFCYDCARDMWGPKIPSDFKGCCKKGKLMYVLCEGCGGYIYVNHDGKRKSKIFKDKHYEIKER